MLPAWPGPGSARHPCLCSRGSAPPLPSAPLPGPGEHTGVRLARDMSPHSDPHPWAPSSVAGMPSQACNQPLSTEQARWHMQVCGHGLTARRAGLPSPGRSRWPSGREAGGLQHPGLLLGRRGPAVTASGVSPKRTNLIWKVTCIPSLRVWPVALITLSGASGPAGPRMTATRPTSSGWSCSREWRCSSQPRARAVPAWGPAVWTERERRQPGEGNWTPRWTLTCARLAALLWHQGGVSCSALDLSRSSQDSTCPPRGARMGAGTLGRTAPQHTASSGGWQAAGPPGQMSRRASLCSRPRTLSRALGQQ